jgi:iron complex outermembrane receptor protein
MKISIAIRSSCAVAALALSAGLAAPASAQEAGTAAQASASDDSSDLGEIIVTAQRREERLKDVPVSVTAVTGERLNTIQSAGADIRGLAGRIPSLNVESSFGRTFPRFYIRGLGNTDFDLNASQPVSLVYDDVVLENPILKGFPIFDTQRVEVLRGPQGTLFGRNTPAGIVKFDSVRPEGTPGGFVRASYGSYGTINLEGAAGGDLSDTTGVRLSGLYQHRDNWVTNTGTPAGKNLEGFNDVAVRAQLQFKPSETLTVRLVGQVRTEDGTARLFRANAFAKGSNKLIGLGGAGTPFDIKQVRTDGINFQKLNTYNLAGTIELDLGGAKLTSVTSWWNGNLKSRGDIDGGIAGVGPGFIPFSAQSEDDVPALDQFTQEVRLASSGDGPLTWQGGVFYFNEKLKIDSFDFTGPQSTTADVTVHQRQVSDAWGLFGSLGYKLTPELTVQGGVRYNHDKRDYTNSRTGFFGAIGTGAAKVSEDNVTWDASLRYAVSPDTNLYARVAKGYRAPSIQGRALFVFTTVQDSISTAKSETDMSYEAGVKSSLGGGIAHFNLAGFYYRLKNAQLTAVGGTANAAKLVNAAKVDGYGFEAEFDVKPVDALILTAGVSYNFTEIKDPNLYIEGCGGGCTVLDPLKPLSANLYSVNGNSLPQAPRWTANWTARYGVPLGNGEFYVYTDWAYRSKVNFFLYESAEFNSDHLLEGGVRVVYKFGGGKFDLAGYVRNVTNDIQAVSAIDFNNLTGMVNEPRIFGVEFGAKF